MDGSYPSRDYRLSMSCQTFSGLDELATSLDIQQIEQASDSNTGWEYHLVAKLLSRFNAGEYRDPADEPHAAASHSPDVCFPEHVDESVAPFPCLPVVQDTIDPQELTAFNTPPTDHSLVNVSLSLPQVVPQNEPPNDFTRQSCQLLSQLNERETFKCPKCPLHKPRILLKGKAEHMRTHDPNGNRFRCHHCSCSYTRSNGLKVHLRNVHNEHKLPVTVKNYPRRCQGCGRKGAVSVGRCTCGYSARFGI